MQELNRNVADLGLIHVTYEARKPRNRKLWVVSTQFNPAGYRSLENNYRRFAEHVSLAGVNLLTAELSYPGQRPTLTGPEAVQYRARDVMWHKERLLNLAIDRLPPECEAVAWVDADVLFTNENWVEDTLNALDDSPVVQMFEKVFLLDSQGNHYRDAYGFAFSLVSGFLDDYADRYSGYWHGNMKHPGFAWAARRESLRAWGGLYDHHILGGGDFQMALAFVGDRSKDWYSRFGREFQSHMLDWSERVHADTRGKLGFTPGCALHLWHGHSEDRQYVERSKCLVDHGFDPRTDIRMGHNGLWEWATDKPELHRKVADYFKIRKDDRTLPVHPTRYEDKYPVILNAESEASLRKQLTALAAQDRRDFAVWVAFADWQQSAKLKGVARDEPWPFEVRLKSAYQSPQKLTPRQFQVVKAIGPENRSKKVLFVRGETTIPTDFITRCVRAPGSVVVDGDGRVVCASTCLVKSEAAQAETGGDGDDRLKRVAADNELRVVQIRL